MHVNDLLTLAVEAGASDLHLKVGSYPMMRVRGELVPASEEKRLDHEDTVNMAAAVMSTQQRQKFKDSLEIDLAYSVPGPGPVPLQRLPAARHDRHGPPRHPDRRPQRRRSRPAAGAQDDRLRGARPGPRHRHHRQRQVDHPGGPGGSRQRHALRARGHGRRPDRVPASRQPRRSSISARSRWTRGRSRTPCAAPCARTPTSSSSAKCATTRRSRRRCSPLKRAISCSRRCTRSMRPRRSTASSRCFRRTSRSRSACSWRAS